MRREETGIVIETSENKAKVKASRHGDCENCGVCPGDNAMVVAVQNPIDASVGQRVAFEIQEANMLMAAFVVYILPLLALMVGAISGGILGNNLGQACRSAGFKCRRMRTLYHGGRPPDAGLRRADCRRDPHPRAYSAA